MKTMFDLSGFRRSEAPDYGSLTTGVIMVLFMTSPPDGDVLPEFGGDTYSADNFMQGRGNGFATYRNTDFWPC